MLSLPLGISPPNCLKLGISSGFAVSDSRLGAAIGEPVDRGWVGRLLDDIDPVGKHDQFPTLARVWDSDPGPASRGTHEDRFPAPGPLTLVPAHDAVSREQ